jgi:hypothetical protein
VGEEGVVIEAVPEITVQFPVPAVGELPAKVAEVVAHKSWSGPASAEEGVSSTIITTSLVELGQNPLLIVHLNVELPPTVNPVTPEVGSETEETVPVPDTTLHTPVPTVGGFPASVAVVVLQRFWLGPALAVVGVALTVITISSDVVGQTPLEVVHLKVEEEPMVNPVTPEVGEDGVVTETVPESTDHDPVPTAGVFPARVDVVTLHKPWSEPALAVVGLALVIILTSSKDEAQAPLVIVHLIVTVVPWVMPVMVVPGSLGLVIVALPDWTDQVPIPTLGVFPAKVAEEEQTVWSGPASAGVTIGSLTFIVTLLVEAGQEPLVIVHLNTELPPIVKPVTSEVGEEGVVTEAVPDIADQLPVPTVGVLAANVVVVVLQRFWFAPALDVVGDSSTLIVTSLVEGGQTPLLIVHLNTELLPIVKPVTPEVGEAGVVTEAEPDTTDQAPVPTVGVFPASVAVVVLQRFWLGPALATVGLWFTVIETSEVLGVHVPFVIVHLKTEVPPMVSPVTPELCWVLEVTLTEPDTTDQEPVPIAGMFPAKVATVVLHSVWLVPALAVVGGWTLYMVISSSEGAHPPLDIDHLNLIVSPAVKAVMVVPGSAGSVMVAAPEITVHKPVPVAGLFPAKVAEAWLQRFWSGPALDAVGRAATVIVISSKFEPQAPLEIVHRKT